MARTVFEPSVFFFLQIGMPETPHDPNDFPYDQAFADGMKKSFPELMFREGFRDSV